ncbi:unnamed protein product [Urochloa decumbens]|uniref:DC1 domain-containing protein n=1 Tax=Urochloa decumbens TaxID=240449 RepID=A0ABC9G2J4_9POAL
MAEADGSITHFSHPGGHELVKRHNTGPFLCYMCWEDLSGLTYGCRAGCNFAIHDACAGHPQTLFSPAHHQHQLVLVETRRDVAQRVRRQRRPLRRRVLPLPLPAVRVRHGPALRAPAPRRAQLAPPRRARPDLALVVGEGRCAACRHGGRAWYYRCTMCGNVDLHISCAAAGEVDARARHGHAPGAGNGVPRDLQVQGELLRARIEAESAMAFASTMANAGASMKKPKAKGKP